MSEASSLKEKIIKSYRTIKYRWAYVVLLILAACICFDLCPCEYYPVFEKVFSINDGDFTGIAAMILVVWTFSMALVVFWMGRMEDNRYGIRI